MFCRRLDGIPLAIELAAARVRSLSPEDLVSRLDQRFKLLTHGSRAALERHQTLRSTIDWSYDLLTPTERHALQRLSVFAGGCDLAAAEAVLPDDMLDAADVVDVLGQLVDKSLVVVDDADSGMRYRLLETIRQYAQERLDAGDDPARCDIATPTTMSPWQKLPVPTCGAETTSSGPASSRRRRQLPCRARLGGRDTLPGTRVTPVAPLAVPGRTGELAMDWAATAIAIPGGDDHPLLPVVAAWAVWAATLGRDFERAETLLRSRNEPKQHSVYGFRP